MMNSKKKELVVIGVSVVAFLTLIFWNQYWRAERELARNALCYQHIKETNLPVTVCIHLGLAADGAYNDARGDAMAWLVLAGGLILQLELRNRTTQAKVRELEERLNA